MRLSNLGRLGSLIAIFAVSFPAVSKTPEEVAQEMVAEGITMSDITSYVARSRAQRPAKIRGSETPDAVPLSSRVMTFLGSPQQVRGLSQADVEMVRQLRADLASTRPADGRSDVCTSIMNALLDAIDVDEIQADQYARASRDSGRLMELYSQVLDSLSDEGRLLVEDYIDNEVAKVIVTSAPPGPPEPVAAADRKLVASLMKLNCANRAVACLDLHPRCIHGT